MKKPTVATTTSEQRFFLQLSEARKQFALLRDWGKDRLEAEYQLSHQVCDTHGMTRTNLVFNILRDRFPACVVDSL